MENRKVKAVLFDLDGTLLDTLQDIGACVNDVLRRYGYPERDMKEFRELVGHGARNLLAAVLPGDTTDETLDEILQVYVEHYRDNCARYTTYYPGVQSFLAYLSECGCKLGVITNKTQPIADRIIERYLPDVPFVIMWGNNSERPLKPSPESARLACEQLGVSPAEVLFIGDGDTDMEFASNAGFLAGGVTWGYRPRQTLIDCGADFLADSFAELQEIVKKFC